MRGRARVPRVYRCVRPCVCTEHVCVGVVVGGPLRHPTTHRTTHPGYPPTHPRTYQHAYSHSFTHATHIAIHSHMPSVVGRCRMDFRPPPSDTHPHTHLPSHIRTPTQPSTHTGSTPSSRQPHVWSYPRTPTHTCAPASPSPFRQDADNDTLNEIVVEMDGPGLR